MTPISLARTLVRSGVVSAARIPERVTPDLNAVQAAHVAIGAWVGTDGPPGVSAAAAEEVAPLYRDMHMRRDEAERVFTARSAPGRAVGG